MSWHRVPWAMTQLGAVPGEFHIPAAVSLHSHRTRTLKSGDAFGVFDMDGDVPGILGSTDGLYFRDTHHLSKLVLVVSSRCCSTPPCATTMPS